MNRSWLRSWSYRSISLGMLRVMEREALEKHDDEGPPEQYVYVRN